MPNRRTGPRRDHPSLSTSQLPRLPALFPTLGPATRFSLLADFGDVPPPPLSSWDDELDVLTSQRLAAISLRLIDERALPVRRATIRRLNEGVIDWSLSTKKMSEHTVPFLTSLHRNVPFAVIKGPGLTEFYATTPERPYSDYDIVVTPPTFSNALRMLRSRGFFEKQATRPPWDSFSRFCREAVNLVHESGARIDLHHHIPPWIWGRHLDPSTITANATLRGLAALPIASPLDNYFIVVLHILSDHDAPGQTLLAWRDVLSVTRHLDPDDIISAASHLELSGILRWILSSLPEPVRPGHIIARLEGARVEHSGRFIARSLNQTFRQSALTYPTRLPLANAAYYSIGMTFPPRSYLRLRYPDASHPRVTWWLTALRDASRQLPDHSEPPE